MTAQPSKVERTGSEVTESRAGRAHQVFSLASTRRFTMPALLEAGLVSLFTLGAPAVRRQETNERARYERKESQLRIVLVKQSRIPRSGFNKASKRLRQRQQGSQRQRGLFSHKMMDGFWQIVISV